MSQMGVFDYAMDADEEIEKSYKAYIKEINELNARIAELKRKLQRGGRERRRKTLLNVKLLILVINR